MSEIALKILISLAGKLLTEAFMSRMLVHAGRFLAKKTTNDLDDKLVDDVAKALGVDP